MSSIPLDEWSGSGATRALHETIKAEAARTRQALLWAKVAGVCAILSVALAVAALVVAL